MKIKIAISTLFATASIAAVMAQGDYPVAQPRVTIPTPPMGERWILNDTYSDEFNGSKLDDKKWFDHHPTWKGRAPGLFESKNVALEDGKLVLSGGLRDASHDMVGRDGGKQVFDISCAAVVSKEELAHYGYYEARVQANKTSLSTTFWLSRGGSHQIKGNQPEWLSEQGGTYGQELDICETIGRTGTEEEGWNKFSGEFYTGMNSNVHCWWNSPSTGRTDVAINKIPRLQPEDGSVLSDGFNVYGCWWKNESSAEFYMNNKSNGHRDFVDRKGRDFYLNKPMGLNLVVETYAWIPRPTDEDLTDPTKNKTYYDWVRHYILVGADEKVAVSAPEQCEVFEDYLLLGGRDASPQSANGVSVELQYSAPVDRKLIVEVYNAKGKSVGSKSFDAYAGFANSEYELGAKLKSGESYTVVAYVVESGAKSAKGYLAGDSFGFTAK